jgi:hypothetical protein
MSMMSMQQAHHAPSAHANITTFYLGLVSLVTALLLAAWRRHRHECRPLVRLPQLLAIRH